MKARVDHDITSWFKFFLHGIIDTANNGVQTFEKLMALQRQYDGNIATLGSRSANASKVVNELYKHPMIDAQRVSEITNLSPASSYTLIDELEKLGILREVTGGKRKRRYMLFEYIRLFHN